MPKVLESIYRYYIHKNIEDSDSEDSEYDPDEMLPRPLSIIYEVLRGYKMPELYESRVGTS